MRQYDVIDVIVQNETVVTNLSQIKDEFGRPRATKDDIGVLIVLEPNQINEDPVLKTNKVKFILETGEEIEKEVYKTDTTDSGVVGLLFKDIEEPIRYYKSKVVLSI